jgi:hypothetical protein
MTEAPYSVNVRVQHSGYVFQITIRKQERDALLEAMAGLPAWLEAHGYEPGEPVRHASQATQATEQIPLCPYHGPMKPSEKAKGTWYRPSKMGNGSYGKERVPRDH